MNTLLKMRGGHSINLRNQNPAEVADTLDDRIGTTAEGKFYFFNDGNLQNAVAVKPADVVAVIKVEQRR